MTTQMLEQKQNRTTGEMLTQVPGSIPTKGLVPAKLAGILLFKWAMFNRLTSTLIPRYHRAFRRRASSPYPGHASALVVVADRGVVVDCSMRALVSLRNPP